ncbi:MAG: hypothetical protein E6G91_14610 [Alphaproteobacteria bacterium]|nr:MAG: hypothetical protein E6G91_14610 [Alphaproteobacteria bacterium]
MGKKLTAAQIDQYHRDGYVYPIDAFGAEQAQGYRAAMEKFEAAQGTELGSTRSSIIRPSSMQSRT